MQVDRKRLSQWLQIVVERRISYERLVTLILRNREYYLTGVARTLCRPCERIGALWTIL